MLVWGCLFVFCRAPWVVCKGLEETVTASQLAFLLCDWFIASPFSILEYYFLGGIIPTSHDCIAQTVMPMGGENQFRRLEVQATESRGDATG
jgi:hypothetical protein